MDLFPLFFTTTKYRNNPTTTYLCIHISNVRIQGADYFTFLCMVMVNCTAYYCQGSSTAACSTLEQVRIRC